MAIAPAPIIPGPRPLPMFGWRGNLIRFLHDPVAAMRAAQRYGDIVAVARGNPGWLFTFHPTYTRQLLTDPDLFFSNPFMPAPDDTALKRLTNGLLSMNGAKWRQQRKLIMPAFHRKVVEACAEDMVGLIDAMLATWQPGQPIDLAAEMQRLTLRIATKTLYGMDATGATDRLGVLLKRWLDLHESPLNLLLPYDKPGTVYRRLLHASEAFEVQFREIIAWRRTMPPGQRDVLSLLLHAHDEHGDMLSEDELLGQASILLNAGHETTSNALTWTLFLLSQHPAVLADLQDELRGVLGGGVPSVAQLGQLPLLDQVIKESMRVLPPVCFSMRLSTAPFQLGPYALGKNTAVFFSQFSTHHDPRLYDAPDRFLPGRWETIDPSPYEYLPFGAGPRMCIGASFALLEIKLVLAMLLQRFQLALAPRARIDHQIKITLSPTRGMPMLVARPDYALPLNPARGTVRALVDLP